MSDLRKGPTPLRPVPLCHRLLAAPAGVARSCVGSACSMWALVWRADGQHGPDGFCSEVRADVGYMPPWLDPAQDAPEPAAMPAEALVEPPLKSESHFDKAKGLAAALGECIDTGLGAVSYSFGVKGGGYYVAVAVLPDRVRALMRLTRSWAQEDGVAPTADEYWPGGAPSESAPKPDLEPVPSIERLRYDGKTVEWRAGRGSLNLYPEGSDGLEFVAAVGNDGRWHVYPKITGWANCGYGTADPPSENAAKTAALRALLAEGVLTIEPEPVSKPAPDADLGPVPSPCWRRDSHGLVDDQAPQEKPKGLVRALGQSELRLAEALRELETTRIALAEAEAELERLGSTRAVSYEYQIKWES